jgi:DNA-binding GntR family transcriptional regulator
VVRPGTFERVYAAIRQQLREGAFRPGERLEPAALAEELNASVTPVRDALHRLTGERLVEAPRHEGFRTPMLTETTLRHLYAWHRDLLLLAILNRRDALAPVNLWPGSPDDEVASFERQNRVFLALAEATSNPEHAIALRSLTERLEPVQRLEDSLLDSIEEESAAIIAALRERNRAALRRGLIHYHRRRERIVPELIERLYASPANNRTISNL